MYDRRGKSVLCDLVKMKEALSKINMHIAYVEYDGKLVPCVQHNKPVIIYMDELTEEPKKVYNKQSKIKAQWKREINPRKH